MTCLECHQMLSPYDKGELPHEDARRVADHLAQCRSCAQRLEGLRQLDDILRAMPMQEPSSAVLLAVRDRVHGELAGGEILDAGQVAAYLKLSRGQVLDHLDELPCFEVAGEIRFRRTALMEWIEERERARRREALRVRIAGESVIDVSGQPDPVTLET